MIGSTELSDLGVSTQLSVIGRNPDEQCGFVNPPLYKGSTIIHKKLEDLEQRKGRFFYGTAGSPTIANLEDAWTHLTGGAGTVLSPSGLGSISLALLTLSKAGDHILITDSVYIPTRMLCDGLLAKFGIETEYYDPSIGEDIEKLVKSNTTVIFLESPGSGTMEVQDIPALVSVAKKHGIKTILDNTWATPLFFDAHAHGIDISVEAGTKYLGGHSDLLLGLASANEECWPLLRSTYDAMAMLPGAEDCLLALRGMRSLHLRLKDAERKALNLAAWLENRDEVEIVLHPAFKDCPGHEYWVRDYKGSSGLFSIVLKDGFTRAGLENMVEKMKIFQLGFSWGGYDSLITPVNPPRQRKIASWSHHSFALRIQVGLEDFEDLKTDLELGFERLADEISMDRLQI
ncbi:BBM_1a_G0017590.mRNA.1.CDS.1 [Saccharomyces cerevisiae]|nr:CPI_1c_G0017690.mRNA.1.CDS.1 [Saccharomyces cerevisiae]CAI4453657.1 BBM_1a_G0017590.mRNA.1.CDS.1 [Saccharomyces cerevisiae]CAI7111126.1 BBM_1a_G0017590.mRNA.1.CDS.1 [Saccharomyces cerevisiae]CAI7281830.1 CPI_1c_G0017690.mRNA.1.CDS.1 [Saccharomyces cerevisiae]